MTVKISREKIFLIFLLVLSLIRFFYKIGDRAMFEYDQEFLALEAKKIIIDKKLTLIGAPTSVGGMFIGPLYSYLVAFLMFVLKMNPYVIESLSAFWGTMTLIAIYLVSLDWFSFLPALFASLTALLSFPFLDGVPPLVKPLALLSLLTLWALLKVSKDKRYFLLVTFLTGWAFNLHFSAVFFPFLVGLSLWLIKLKVKTSQLLISLLILLLFISPLILFEIRHDLFMTRNFLNFLRENTGSGINPAPGSWCGEGLTRSFKISSEHLGNLVFIDQPLLQLILVFASFLFTLKILWQKKPPLFKAFLVWLVVPILFFSLYGGHIIPYYFILQEIILFPALGLFFASVWKKKFLRFLLILFLLVFLRVNFNQWFSWQVARSLKNKIIALEFVKKHSQNQPIYLSHTIEPGVDGGFHYLEWYLGIKKREEEGWPIYTLIAPVGWQDIKADYIFGDYGVNLPR